MRQSGAVQCCMPAVDRYDECTLALREIYEDKDGMRKEEVSYSAAEFPVLTTALLRWRL